MGRRPNRRFYGPPKRDPQLGPPSASIAIESLKILQNLVQLFDPGGEGLQRGARRTPSSSPEVRCMPHDRHRRLRIAADAQIRTPQLATCQHHCLASVELICAVPCVSLRPNDGFGIRSPKFPQRSPSTGRHGGAVTLSGQAGGVCSLVQWPFEGEPLLERCASPASPPEIPRSSHARLAPCALYRLEHTGGARDRSRRFSARHLRLVPT